MAATLALTGAVALGACGAGSVVSGLVPTSVPTVSATVGPTSGWGPGMWGGHGASAMMGGGDGGSWAPGRMGRAMMGDWYLAGNASRVQTLGEARQRAQAFAGRLGLRVGEVMQFSRNFYAQLNTMGGRPATEVLVNPVDGAVQIEYGPAMMWNTDYGMHYGSPTQERITAWQAHGIAQEWLRGRDTGLTADGTESFPGYYTLHVLKSGEITGMLSVNASTGQVWYHNWHGEFIAMSHG